MCECLHYLGKEMKRKNIKVCLLVLISTFLFISMTYTGQRKFIEVRRYKIPEARQGIAVDKNYLYAIDTRAIAKYEKSTGKLVSKWEEEKDGPIKHLDSGVIINNKLYCAHSNYPEFPMTSSIEIWDVKSLKHIGSHSFGINWGSCTWVDRYQNYWWAAFAHYNKWKDSTNTDVRWTTVIKFDDKWRMLESWIFPSEVSKKFGKMSNSGGTWGPDGYLYCTGHDASELYVLKLPSTGSVLELIETVPIDCTGQGFAWDRSDSESIYTIDKAKREVIQSKFIR